MTAELLAMQLVTGLALGALLVLVAVGLSLIFGLLTVVNFAHGALYMVGAYVGVYLFGLTGDFWTALFLVPLAVGTLGMAVERLLVRPLYGRPLDYPLLLTFGLAYILVDLVRLLFGVEGMPFDTPVGLRGAADLGFGFFPWYRLFLIGFSAVLLLGLWLFIERTPYGLIIRAGAQDAELLRILGIDVGRLWMAVFGLGTGIAGLAGLLSAPIRGVTPEMGAPVLIEAFVVTVVGGMGSLAGAVVAGLLIGVAVSMTSLFAPEMGTLVMFATMAIVLIARPRGLFGRASVLG